ncbi:hypothetical protein DFH27DRAFT_629729 [Peziza echinospora]|nr:hypothetical protein DFH27DRAFT_629729 [Peziza echinospora]
MRVKFAFPWPALCLVLAFLPLQAFCASTGAHSLSPRNSEVLSGPVVLDGPINRQGVRQIESERRRRALPQVPSIWTRNFGDCMRDASVTINYFEAAYHAHNMTFIWPSKPVRGAKHPPPSSRPVAVGADKTADGETRFELLFDPCKSMFKTLCPASFSTPIQATHEIPLSDDDISGIPEIALYIPDFEGRAVFRIFSNTTKNQVGCISADLVNGVTFSHVTAISSLLGGLTLAAIFTSATSLFLRAREIAYSVPALFEYSTTPSAGFLLSILQTIFLTGILPLNFPSNLVGFWSNFAWASGIVYIRPFQSRIDSIRDYKTEPIELGYNYDVIKMLYGLYAPGSTIARRSEVEYGVPVKEGLPIPGTYFGFPAILAALNITAQNAFLTGIFTILISYGLLVIPARVARMILYIGVKWRWFPRRWNQILETAEGGRRRVTKYAHFINGSEIRWFTIAIFPLLTLAFYESASKMQMPQIWSSVTLFGVIVIGLSQCYMLYLEENSVAPYSMSLNVKHFGAEKIGPWYVPWWRFSLQDNPKVHVKTLFYVPSLRWQNSRERPAKAAPIYHGMAARFRGEHTWLFSWVILPYEVVRSALLGRCQSQAVLHIALLLVLEVVYFLIQQRIKPYGPDSLHFLRVQAFSAMKILTLVLVLPLAPQYNLNRIVATALGIIVIFVQGILIITVICHMLLTFLGYALQAINSRPPPQRAEESRRTRRMARLTLLEGALAKLRIPALVKLLRKIRAKLSKSIGLILPVVNWLVNIKEVPRELTTQERVERERAEAQKALEQQLEASFEMKELHRYPKIEDDHGEDESTNTNATDAPATTANVSVFNRPRVDGRGSCDV